MNQGAQMLLYAFLSYADDWQIDNAKAQKGVKDTLLAVQDTMGFEEIVWGPAASKPEHRLFSDVLMYALRLKSSDSVDEYLLAIRGTNPFAVASWTELDLDVSTRFPWSRQSPHTTAPPGALISCATDTALSHHKELSDGEREGTFLEWLSGKARELPSGKKIHLSLAGHSLGGLMSTTFALYLYDELVYMGLGDMVSLSAYSFAGPTAGNGGFARYTAQKLKSYTCYENPFDIATKAWVESEMVQLPKLYSPIQMNLLERKLFDHFIKDIHNKDYSAIGNVFHVPQQGICDIWPFNQNFVLQALFQHVGPYLLFAFEEAPEKVVEIIVDILNKIIVAPANTLLSILTGGGLFINREDLVEATRKVLSR